MDIRLRDTKRSAHVNKGMDFHLRMIGIEDRADWEIVSIDSRRLETELSKGRPDWIVRHREGARYKIVEYKNRDLVQGGTATAYELYQVVIYAVLLQEMVYRQTGQRPEVEAQLLYADGELVTATYTQEDVRTIMEKSLEARTVLFFLGLHKGTDERPTVTELARYLVDPDFTDTAFGWTAKQVAGVEAHHALANLGPKVVH